MKNALIIFGGVSSEHNVSCVSATSVIRNIPKDKYNVTTKVVTDDYKGKNMICSRCKTLVAIIEKPKAARGYIVLPIVSAQC